MPRDRSMTMMSHSQNDSDSDHVSSGSDFEHNETVLSEGGALLETGLAMLDRIASHGDEHSASSSANSSKAGSPEPAVKGGVDATGNVIEDFDASREVFEGGKESEEGSVSRSVTPEPSAKGEVSSISAGYAVTKAAIVGGFDFAKTSLVSSYNKTVSFVKDHKAAVLACSGLVAVGAVAYMHGHLDPAINTIEQLLAVGGDFAAARVQGAQEVVAKAMNCGLDYNCFVDRVKETGVVLAENGVGRG